MAEEMHVSLRKGLVVSVREKGGAAYQFFLLGLSIYVLAILLIESFVVANPETKVLLQYVDLSICLIFLADFFVNLYKAPSKLGYLKWGWIDFVASIPMIDPLRWGRISRLVRILRFFRAIKSLRLLAQTLYRSKYESLTLTVLLVVFFSYTSCAGLILEFEQEVGGTINTASEALWWAFLNILNAKVAIDEAQSTGGVIITVVLNKVGLLVFAYANAMIIAWLLDNKKNRKNVATVSSSDC